MIVKVENLGVIKKGEVDISRPFTLFVGPNNSGKTWMGYVIYAALKGYTCFIPDKIIESLISELIEKNFVSLNMTKFIENNIGIIYEEFSKNLKSNLSSFYNLNSKNFSKTKINFLQNKEYLQSKISKHRTFNIRNNFEINKGTNSTNLNFRILNIESIQDKDTYYAYIKSEINYILSFYFFENCFFELAERNALSLFGVELLKNRLNRQISLLKDELPNYSFPINTNIDKISIKKNITQGVFFDLAYEFEQTLLKGSIEQNEVGAFQFTTQDVTLPLHGSASVVKAMASLITTLKYEAKEGDTIIIDEPEMNLHGDNQRIVARYLAKLANSGLKIIVSTHSFTFVQELNNLLMLGSEKAKTQPDRRTQIMNENGYQEAMLLNQQNVNAYHFHNGTIDLLEISDRGIDASLMEKIIQSINQTTRDIFFDLIDVE